jgi:hypothetical protein
MVSLCRWKHRDTNGLMQLVLIDLVSAYHNLQESSFHVFLGHGLECRSNVHIVGADGRPARIHHLVNGTRVNRATCTAPVRVAVWCRPGSLYRLYYDVPVHAATVGLV